MNVKGPFVLVTSSKVSIPYRQAMNQNQSHRHPFYRSVSIPYRQAMNIFMHLNPYIKRRSFNSLQVGYELLLLFLQPVLSRVSIPYRQAMNNFSAISCISLLAVSIPYRQAMNTKQKDRRSRTAIVSIPYRQAMNFLNRVNVLCFQSGFNSLQVGYEPGRTETEEILALVSIPYRQAMNLLCSCQGRQVSFVSIPYRQAMNEAFICNYYFCEGVSIPYRQAMNFPLASYAGFKTYSFNSLQVGYERQYQVYLPQ